MRIAGWLVLGALAGLPSTSPATTWAETKIKDPVSGRDCSVSTPMSSGSYIYQWPEKYDQVFWPMTDAQGIWTCATSGFAAFIGDVELDDHERDAIAGFLRDAGPLPKKAEPAQVLERLEAIYALRKLEPDRESWILRALAYQYESIGSQDRAGLLRAKAGALMEERLADKDLQPDMRLQYLFVTANYARERGDTKASDSKLEQLSSLLADASNDEKLKGYAEYLAGLIETARKIAPGGTLAPSE